MHECCVHVHVYIYLISIHISNKYDGLVPTDVYFLGRLATKVSNGHNTNMRGC